MTITLTHAYQSAKSDGGNSALVRPSNWNAQHTFTSASGVILGKSTSGSGTFSEYTLGDGLSFSGTTLNATGSYAGPNYQLFTSSGTWTKPNGTSFVFVRVVGSGGGGWGGGITNPGYGGSGGLCFENIFNSASLSSSVSVTIGAAGTGGAGSSVSALGSAGGNAGYSSFGSYLFANGGVGSVVPSSQYSTYYHGVTDSTEYIYYEVFNSASGVGGEGFGTFTKSGRNGPLGPAGGGPGGQFNSGTSVYTYFYGGIGFALRVSSPTIAEQCGNTSPYGTAAPSTPGAAGVDATSTGYGGSGGAALSTNSSGQTAGAGGSGYLGGGGGGGGRIYQYGGATGGSGGSGGNGGTGFVEVFSW